MSLTEKITNEVCLRFKDYINGKGVKGTLELADEILNLKEKNNLTDDDIEELMVWLKCDAMNEYEEGFLKGYDCKKCNNRGYMNTYERVNGKLFYPIAVDCECKRIRAMYAQLEQCGITQRQAQKYTLDNYSTEEAWQNKAKNTALKYLEEFKLKGKKFDNWFIATGRSGGGKSHLCCATYIELLKLGMKGKFMLWKVDGDKLLKLKKSYEVHSYDKLIQPFKVAEVLYIDDMFKLLPQDGADRTHLLDIAFTILDARYNNGLPTIISTEESMGDIMMLDDAIYGRIKEMIELDKFLVQLDYSVDRDMRRR
jgi:DNA replication protein DnaC